MSLSFDQIFSMYHCVFRKGINPQHYVIVMLEKWILSKDKCDFWFFSLLVDLSKDELLLVKVAAYGFSPSALKLIHTYLFDRKQRIKINIFYSSWQDIFSGISQGSILGPLLFNIFLCDLFLVVNNIGFESDADDNTHHTTD